MAMVREIVEAFVSKASVGPDAHLKRIQEVPDGLWQVWL
jgi:hypothetical protein